MTTDRRFCRFNKGASISTGRPDFGPLTTTEIPPGGLCLSAFLLVADSAEHEKILMGHLNPKAPWDHIGALDEGRIEVHSKGLMLPSSHLMIRESPFDAAKRISREQLELEDGVAAILQPKVFSDVYKPKRFPELDEHWDIGFVFSTSIPKSKLREHVNAWTDIQFVDPKKIEREEFARSHDDVLRYAGFKIP